MNNAADIRPSGTGLVIGLIVPPTNTVNETEWRAALPGGFTLRVARMPLHDDIRSARGRWKLVSDLADVARVLVQEGADAIAYGCTAGSLIQPLDWLGETMRAMIGRPCVATAPALVLAARHLGVRRIAVATPYHNALNDHEAEYLTACGFDVLRIQGLGVGAGGPHEYAEIARLPAERIERLALQVAAAGGDALVLSCTDLATLALHDKLERELDRPVISSNQATLWACLRAADRDTRQISWGTLMNA